MGSSMLSPFVVVFGLIVLAIPSVALVMMVVGLVMLAKQRGRAGAAVEGNCVKCGYLVAGLSTFVCPECGSDLRVVGIVAPRRSRGLAMGLTIIGAAVLALICTGFFGLFFLGVARSPTAGGVMAPAPRPATTVQIARPMSPRVTPPTTAPAPASPPPTSPVDE